MTRLGHGGGCDAVDPFPRGASAYQAFYRPSVGRTEQTRSSQRVATSPINGFVLISFSPWAWLSRALSPRPLVRAARLSDARGSSRMPPGRSRARSLALRHRVGERPMRFALRPGDLLRSFHSARRLRHFLAFGRSTRPSLNSSGPFSSRLLRRGRSSALAAPSARLSITLAANSLARVAFS